MLSIREWSREEWLNSELPWEALLARSGLDPLFLSWGWATAWWRRFGNRSHQRLRIVAAYRDGELVGLAPLYAMRVGRRLLPVSSLQFIGIAWRDHTALISEYLDFIAAPGDRLEVRCAIMDYLAQAGGWSEFLVNFTREPQEWIDAFAGTRALSKNSYARTLEPCVSYQADLSKGFAAYLRGLGQSTRRSLWHLRRRLTMQGAVELEHVGTDGVAAAFEHLNRLHISRWGVAAFSGDRLGFHQDLAANLARRGELAMSLLRMDGQVISVLYDVRKNGCQYNLKMAFDQSRERRCSLGLIHFGYALEHASQAGMSTYDFLAGPGRATDFKQHLAQTRVPLATVQLLKGRLMSRLYRFYDR